MEQLITNFTIPSLQQRIDQTINVHNLSELQYWAETFQITQGELRIAVALVGKSVSKVNNFVQEYYVK